MVTNTITIVAIIVMSLSIVSTSVVFGESQEYDPRSQEDVTFEDIPRANSDYEQDEDYDQYLRTQSHGFIKNKDIGVLVYTHGNPMVPHTADTMKTELIEKNLEKMGHPSEIVTHMPYNWDQGLMNLDKENISMQYFFILIHLVQCLQ
ncbi:MAG: hypothetical protein ACXWFB_11555 [Nitrososphaeraceae archaeon]